jgi:phenylacetate-CoA ligase
VITGEEPLAENARIYLERILGIKTGQAHQGMVVSSMGVAELGLNLFFETPPRSGVILLRRLLHQNETLRHALIGPVSWVPVLFTYDPHRLYVEFDAGGRLLVTTLAPHERIPLIRYATGDRGRWLHLPREMEPPLSAAGISYPELAALPLVAISGRGEHALAGSAPVYPEAVKEGIYHDPGLAELTTANFRLASGTDRARLRIQLSPGVRPTDLLAEKFSAAILPYVRQPLDVVCEAFESFGSGMSLDYERKFQYLAT